MSPLITCSARVTWIWYSPDWQCRYSRLTFCFLPDGVWHMSRNMALWILSTGITPKRSPALPLWRLTFSTGGRCMVVMSVGKTRTVSIRCEWSKQCVRLVRGCITGTPSSFVASWQVDSIKVSHHQATDLGSPRTWCTKAPSCGNNRRKAARTRVQIVAVRRERMAISLRFAQGWQGWVRIHATSSGTMNPRLYCLHSAYRRVESTSDSDPKWSLYLLVPRRLLPWTDPKRSPLLSCSPPGCCHGKIQSDLLYPSLLKRARVPSVRPPLAFLRSPLESLLLGSYFSSSFLTIFIPPIHPRISSLSRFTGCASNLTPLGAPPLVVWLGLTTSWRRTTERKLRGLRLLRRYVSHVSPSPGLVKLLALSNQQARVSFARRVVSPDSLCHVWFIIH